MPSSSARRPLAFVFALLASSLPLSPALADDSAAAPPTGRIVGGHATVPGAYPWQVGLLNRAQPDNFAAQSCGGTLIRPDWVLTAGHCVFGGNPAVDTDVLVSGYDLSNPASGVRIPVVQSILHPGYNDATYDNDIALLQLATPVTGGHYARVTEPVPGPESMVGLLATIIGWGNTSASGSSYPNLLQETQVPIVDSATCNAPASYNGQITPQMFCAGYPGGGQDSCQGDSGGPLVVPDAYSQWVQVGITSWGNGCAQPLYYGIYTRIATFSAWISGQIGLIPTQTTVSYSQNGSTATAQVSVSAIASGYGAPSGTVTVSDGAGNSCTVNVPASSSCSLTRTGAVVTASYAGDTSFGASVGTAAAPVPFLAPWALAALGSGLAAIGAGASRLRRRRSH